MKKQGRCQEGSAGRRGPRPWIPVSCTIPRVTADEGEGCFWFQSLRIFCLTNWSGAENELLSFFAVHAAQLSQRGFAFPGPDPRKCGISPLVDLRRGSAESCQHSFSNFARYHYVLIWRCQELPKQRPRKKQRSEMERCSAQTRVGDVRTGRLSRIQSHNLTQILTASLPPFLWSFVSFCLSPAAPAEIFGDVASGFSWRTYFLTVGFHSGSQHAGFRQDAKQGMAK